MVELLPVIHLSGQRFSPREVEAATGLALSRKNEPGDIGKHGRHRGQPSPYGSASLEVPESIEQLRRLTWLLERATPHAETFRRLGVESAVLHIDVPYRDQCNLVFSPEEMAGIAALQMEFTISCWDCTGQ